MNMSAAAPENALRLSMYPAAPSAWVKELAHKRPPRGLRGQ
jgi:hypothetical protein